jgi:uroporphyrinogen-III synthase
MSFGGARVLTLESRRANEVGRLIEISGGKAVIAPSVKEVPLEDNVEAFRQAERLQRGEVDMMLLLTGVGLRHLRAVLETRFSVDAICETLRKTTLVARGPKPVAVLREMNLAPQITVPEPNTWRELLGAIAAVPGEHVLVQEYGRPAPELHEGLRQQGRVAQSLTVYQYAMPDDKEPLQQALAAVLAGEIDAALFTSSIQWTHLLELAAKSGQSEVLLAAMAKVFVGSVGPTCTETLQQSGLSVQFEAFPPKMGVLVQGAAREFAASRPRD